LVEIDLADVVPAADFEEQLHEKKTEISMPV
jgi:hypothetical protein